MKKYILIIIIIIINIIISVRLVDLMCFKHDYYTELYNDIILRKVYGKSPLRGRIMDSNGNVLVDNKIIKNYVLKAFVNTDNLKEKIINIAKIIHFNKCASEANKRKYYYYLNKEEIDSLVSDDVYNDYRLNKITLNEYMNYKYSLITLDQIGNVNDDEAIIYNIIINNYYYEDKIIKEDLSDEELSLLTGLGYKEFMIDTSYKRVYNYDTSFNDVIGTVGKIPKEMKEYYLNLGYREDDLIGLSYLEEYYEDILRGKKSISYYDQSNNLVKYIDEEKGNDIVLNIDINLQMNIESILKREMQNVIKYPTSKYYDGTYIVISDVETGGILSLIGYKRVNDTFLNDAIGNFKNNYTVGSVVKAASQTVSYMYGVLNDKTLINDSCVKLYYQPEKCSWKNLGSLNDINAIAYSSNYFQFINAIKVSGREYMRNMKLDVSIEDFNKYRDIFKLYGLGNKTGIDVNGESTGLIGKKIAGDLYLNLSIGQYDAYTPLMLNQYINTIANGGVRLKFNLFKYAIDSNSHKFNIKNRSVLNEIPLDEYYIKRIQESLNAVIKYGTGTSYTNNKNMAGKTGTSENIINGENTLTRSFVAYLPYDNPHYAISIVSPNITYKNSINNYSYPLNNVISREISHILFEN